ncbi:MFS transporter [Pseudofrankia asymbiotica]|uniref:MFS transporter n=1 Tax=Pseudofrankia asymbiotica TaxID=1834516 RepID=A0A1V2I0G6_9ACTN|nr:MFS transporter [Pseudofrankia asymbiotica]ONH22354.1 MFS transporter [Pseudofrankia asymbiotica]
MSMFEVRGASPTGEMSSGGGGPWATRAPREGGQAPRPAGLPWAGLLALTAAAFVAVATELLPAGLLTRMSADLRVSRASVGFLVSGYAAASCLAAIPLAALLRGFRRRPVLVGALAAFGLCDAVTAFSGSYPLTFAARLLAGVAGGVSWGMLAGYAARMVPAERQGRAIAVVLAGITIASAAGIPAGAALAAVAGWRASFTVLAALALVLAAWVIWRVPDFPGEPATERVPVRRVVVTPGLRPVFAVTLFLLLGHQSVYTYISPLAQWSRFGDVGVALFVFGGATVVGVWAAGLLVDRHSHPMLLVALCLIAAAMIVMGTLGRVPAVLLVSVATWGAAYGAAPTLLQAAVVNACGADKADVATSIQTTVFNLGIAGGSLTGGIVLERSGAGTLPWAALALITVATMSAVAAAASRRRATSGPAVSGIKGFKDSTRRSADA